MKGGASSRENFAATDRDAAPAGVSWWHLGAALLAICSVLSLSSLEYTHGEGYAQRPIAAALILLAALGVVYVASAVKCLRCPPPLWLAVGVAVLARLILLPGTPIQEDDIYRYLWDGRVLAAGVNPYRFSPADVESFAAAPERFSPAPFSPEEAAELEVLARLARKSEAIERGFSRINHRHYATIYPPVAQAVFWTFGLLVPASWTIAAQVTAMKTLLLGFDLGVLFLMVSLLRRCALTPGLVVLYAWCPLVLKEIGNSGHMDAIPTLFLIAALVALLDGRSVLTGVLLGAAVSAKVYAILVLPLFVKRLGWRRGALALVGAALVMAVSHRLVGTGRERYRETLLSFALLWENHDAVFLWLQSLAAVFTGGDSQVALSWGPFEETIRRSYAAALVLYAAALGGFVVWSTRRLAPATDRREVVRRVFVLLAAFFLLGPVGFPWYFVPCVPLLPFARLRSWWVLPCLLPVYYLRFWFDYHHEHGFAGYERSTAFFDDVVVSLEFGLFYVLLAAELVRRRQRRNQE